MSFSQSGINFISASLSTVKQKITVTLGLCAEKPALMFDMWNVLQVLHTIYIGYTLIKATYCTRGSISVRKGILPKLLKYSRRKSHVIR